MIFIYNRDEIQVDVLDIEPKFTQEISKLNTLEFETHVKLEKGYRVVYKQDGKPYEFIIIDSDYIRGDDVLFTYFCQDSLTELNAFPILDKRPKGSYKQALTSAFENTRWQLVFSGDFSEAYTQNNNFYRISVLEAFSKVAEDYNIEWHTEYTFSGSKITGRKLVISKLGTQSNSRLEFGKNIKQFSRKISSEPIFTALYGYGKGEETESGGYGRRISFADINGGLAYVANEEARLKYGIGPTGSKEHLFGFFIDEEETDKAKLLETTKKELERVSQPQAEYTVDAANLHLDCGIGDTVPVIDDELGFRGNTRIIKVVTQGGNKELTFGQVQKGFTDSFTKEIQKSAEATEIKITSIMEARLNQISDVYFGEDGYNYDLKVGNEYGLPAGLYSFDAPIDQDPTKVIYFGAGKLLIADSKDANGAWAWKTAIDGTGIAGSEILANSITANKLASDVGQGIDISSNEYIQSIVESNNTLSEDTMNAISELNQSLNGLMAEEDIQTLIDELNSKINQNKLEITQTNDSFTQEYSRIEASIENNRAELEKLSGVIQSGLDENGNTYTDWIGDDENRVRVGSDGIVMLSNNAETLKLKDGRGYMNSLYVEHELGLGNHTARKMGTEFTVFMPIGGQK